MLESDKKKLLKYSWHVRMLTFYKYFEQHYVIIRSDRGRIRWIKLHRKMIDNNKNVKY